MTALTNSIFESSREGGSAADAKSATTSSLSTETAPSSPRELLERIQKDYTVNNYLWTGNIDTSAFVPDCTFTDPTLSFVGVDKFIENVGNLVPVVNFLLGKEQYNKSDLLDITLNEEQKYVETRWNMVGGLNKLFWKPEINVIGRTKFWYREIEGGDTEAPKYYQVYFYDEKWEIPAGLALLQLVTPAGTIANSAEEKN